MKVRAITETRDGQTHEHIGYSDSSSERGQAAARASFEHLKAMIGQPDSLGCCQSTNAFGLNWKRNHRLISIELTDEAAPTKGFRRLRHGTIYLG